MSTCKDCKHWDRIRNILVQYPPRPTADVRNSPFIVNDVDDPRLSVLEERPPSGFGRCESPSLQVHEVFPFRVGGSLEMTGTEHNNELIMGEGDGRGDGLATGENFGCIHFERK